MSSGLVKPTSGLVKPSHLDIETSYGLETVGVLNLAIYVLYME